MQFGLNMAKLKRQKEVNRIERVKSWIMSSKNIGKRMRKAGYDTVGENNKQETDTEVSLNFNKQKFHHSKMAQQKLQRLQKHSYLKCAE